MIISHKHKFIFIAIPKTATHAIRFALRQYLGPDDEEQVLLFKESSLSNEKLKSIKHGHITALEARSALNPEIWGNYFKFSFVRNPYDRLASFVQAFYSKSIPSQKYTTVHLKNSLLNPDPSRERWLMPQSKYLFDQSKNCLVDFIGRYENLESDFHHVCKVLKLNAVELSIINSSNNGGTMEHINEETAEMIQEKYCNDFSLLSYAVNSWK